MKIHIGFPWRFVASVPRLGPLVHFHSNLYVIRKRNLVLSFGAWQSRSASTIDGRNYSFRVNLPWHFPRESVDPEVGGLITVALSQSFEMRKKMCIFQFCVSRLCYSGCISV